MRNAIMAALGLAIVLPFGCGTAQEATVRSARTVSEGAQTAGAAAWGTTQTVGGTARGAVTGGASGASEELREGVQQTGAATREQARDTADAARGD